MQILGDRSKIQIEIEILYCRGVVVITTAQLHSTKPELRFCTGSNPARGVSGIRNGEDLWQWSRLEIRLGQPSLVNHTTKAIHHHHHHQVVNHLVFYKRKLVYCACIFQQVNVILTLYEVFLLKFIVLYQLLPYMPLIVLFLFLFLFFFSFGNFHYLFFKYRISPYPRCGLIKD